MEEQRLFRRELMKIAVPVTLQCLLQSSSSFVSEKKLDDPLKARAGILTFLVKGNQGL